MIQHQRTITQALVDYRQMEAEARQASQLHHTVGVYPSGMYKQDAVPDFGLAEHTEYNLTFRPGRAFFVDGKCVHRGLWMDDTAVAHWEAKLSALPLPAVRYPLE